MRLMTRVVVFVLGPMVAGCAVPEMQRRLRADVDAAVARSDEAAGARRYLEHRRSGGDDDDRALDALALAALRDALRAADPGARLAAVRAAERLDEATLFEPVTKLLGDDDEVVRAAAAAAVLHGHPDAPAVLTAALASPDAEARATAVTALGRKVGELAAADVRNALADADAGVREAAIVALASFRLEADRARFEDLTARDPSGPVRARAIGALGPGGVEAARAALADPYLGARLAAVDALHRLLGDRARPILAPLVAGADLLVALRAAGHLGEVTEAVRAAAAALEWAVRAAAANAVRDLLDAGPLEALAADPEPAVALAAARALARVGRIEDARARFAAAATGLSDAQLRVHAAADLLRLGDPLGAKALGDLAGDADPLVRAAAVAALPTRRPFPLALIGALGDDSRTVRVVAAEAILARVR